MDLLTTSGQVNAYTLLYRLLAPDEFNTRENVAPLIRAADLHIATVFLIQMQKVIALQERVAEFGKGDRRLIVRAGRSYHVSFLIMRIHREMFTDIAEEFEKIEFGKPLRIVLFDEISAPPKTFSDLCGNCFRIAL